MSADAVPEGMADPLGPGDESVVMRGRSTRELLEDAAWLVFGEQPYPQAGIAEIAARAGVSMGSFYTYFDSKEALFRVSAGRALEELNGYRRVDPDNVERNPVRDLAYGVRQYFLVCCRLRVIARSIEQAWPKDDEIRHNRRGTLMRGAKRLQRWITDLQDRGICPTDIDPWLTALALQTMTVNLAYDQLVHRDTPQDVDALVGAVVPIWARAVGLERWLPRT